MSPFPPAATATATSLARRAPPKSAPVDDLSAWDDDDDQTLMMPAVKELPPRSPAAPLPPRSPAAPQPPPHALEEEEPELIEAEEILVSSSDAPTIDVSELSAPPPPAPVESGDLNVALAEAPEEAANSKANRPGRSGTIPLFDMSAVLPAASAVQKASSSGSPARAQHSDSPASVSVPAPESKARERKFVIAPATPASPKSRTAGAMVWFGLVAAAAGVLAVVALRGHRSAPLAANTPAFEAPASPLATEAPQVAVGAPLAQDSAEHRAPGASAGERPSDAPPALATAGNVKPVSSLSTTSSNVKPERAVERPTLHAEATPAPIPTVEKPTVETPATPSKPVEARNAPPPAAAGTEFDRGAARDALASAAGQASACRKDGDPSGTATITITFAPSGRITSANLQGPPFAGTATGGCIANTMRRASVPSFSGEHVTVTKTIVIQ